MNCHVTGHASCHVTRHAIRAGLSRGCHATNTSPHLYKPLAGVVCGVSGEDQIQSDRHLGPLAAPIGFGDGR